MADDARPLLVFFYSERSGPARRMESLLAHLTRKERDRMRFRRVDVDLRPDLAERFRVTQVPTLVLVRDKRVVERLEGRVSSPCIERMLEAHLPVAATAASLQEFPELNARLEGEEIAYLDRYDLGVAVQTDDGLVVPVVRGCDTASTDELAAEAARLAEAARAGTLKPEELRGSTFTVTSAGKVAGLFQTPIVNHPEVAILSVGRVAPRPVVRDGELAVALLGYVSLTFDHRVVDGARAAEFGLAVLRRLEQPGAS